MPTDVRPVQPLHPVPRVTRGVKNIASAFGNYPPRAKILTEMGFETLDHLITLSLFALLFPWERFTLSDRVGDPYVQKRGLPHRARRAVTYLAPI